MVNVLTDGYVWSREMIDSTVIGLPKSIDTTV